MSAPNTSQNDALPSGEVSRLFSFARHALVAGFRCLGIGVGSRVLLPELICRDLLAALYVVGAEPLYYPVNAYLEPSTPPDTWPEAAAVLVVNYFGFAQDLAPFHIYTRRSGARLIEDNAHGFLSRDEAGTVLGTRGDVGIFSFRKTYPWASGAALVRGVGGKDLELPSPLLPLRQPFYPGLALRNWASHSDVRRRWVMRLTEVKRLIRRWSKGSSIPRRVEDCETVLPGAANPTKGLGQSLDALMGDVEIARRRALYLRFEDHFRAKGISPAFPRLPEGCSPMGMPFHCTSHEELMMVRGWARQAALDCIPWPELPSANAKSAPIHYRDLQVVNFL